MKISELQHNDLNCNIFSVYDYPGATIQELLCNFFTKINECVKVSNESLDLLNWLKNEGLRKEVAELLVQWLKDGTLAHIINDVVFRELNDKINNTNKTKHLKDWYTPPQKVDLSWGVNGVPPEIDGLKQYEETLNWSYNKLLNDFPSYVTRETLGKDQSGQFNIYSYTFEPEHYDKTILITSCVHGNEYTMFFGVKEFMDDICYNHEGNSILDYLRHNVKIVVMPIVNPWGFVNGRRQNFRAVDLNRNSDYRWDEYTSSKGLPGQVYYKGDSPFSEKETQYIRNVCEKIKNDKFIGNLDFHTITTIVAEKILYYPRFHNNAVNELGDMLRTFTTGTSENRMIFSTSAVPSISNFISWNYRVFSCNPEWCNKAYSSNGTRTAFNMFKNTEYVGNLIYTFAKLNKIMANVQIQPFAKQFVFNADKTLEGQDENRMSSKGYNVVNSSTNSFNNMAVAKHEFTVNGQYVINLNGFIKLTCEKDTTINLQPMLYQRYAPEQNFNAISKNNLNVITLNCKAGQDYIIPINASITSFTTNYNDSQSSRPAEVIFNIRAYCNTSSSVFIESYNISLIGVPTNRGYSVERLRARENMTQELEFPLRVPEEVED